MTFSKFLFLGLAAASLASAAPLAVLRGPDGRRFGLIGERSSRPAPTLFVFQGSLEDAERTPVYVAVARILARQGCLGVVLDAPAHGEDHRAGERAELAAWRERFDRGEDFVGAFTARARALLDYLVREGYTDPGRVAACGTSRGGYLAFQFAAAEPRIRCVGGIAPVTDLGALREFDGAGDGRRLAAMALTAQVPALQGRPVWIAIGNHDLRVGTDRAIAFARALVAADVNPRGAEAPIPVELIVDSTPGHRSTERDHELLAAWLREHF